jgi:peptidoglycan-associated lipoprotein
MFRTLILAFLAVTLSSCAGKFSKTQDFSEEQVILQEDFSENQEQQEFEVVESEEAAEEINAKIQEEIEEVEVSDRIFFGLNQSGLNSEAKSILDNQISWLKSDPSISVIVEGHCDERGTREFNIALGEKRAHSVKNYLNSNGIAAARIKTISYGKERPAFVGGGESVWSKNRRAVTVIEE